MKNNQKPTFILGISQSHTASAALLKNGEIIACASEERFTRKKLQAGTPVNAIKYCLDFANIEPGNLAMVAVADITPPIFDTKSSQFKKPSGLAKMILDIEQGLEEGNPKIRAIIYNIYKKFASLRTQKTVKKRLKNLQETVSVSPDKISFCTHHTAHASTALFSSSFPRQNKDCLIFTTDGVGDFESATISIFKNNKIKKLVSIDSQQSLGFFYQHITQYLGMKAIEDEYKVMGLAPYADEKKSEDVYNRLKPYFKIDKSKNKWIIKISSFHIWRKLPKLLSYYRFDYIASAAQKLLEELLISWTENALNYYKVENAVFGGGVFANVKVNQKIAAIRGLKEAFFMPSPGDESNAIGCAYQGYFDITKIAPKPLKNLYIGPSFLEADIQKLLKTLPAKFKVEKLSDVNAKVANLLAGSQVVARFAGRMEFGARSLGNRSILAHPARRELVEVINSAIKNRDFWMPFAPTILRERTKDYLISHNADSPFMNVAFDTTEKGRADLAAAIHSRDLTTRPQILDRETNPQYYDLIKKFENLTGIGAVLNTSFNLHGEPIVCTPFDAIRVLKLSGLKFLAIENWLIVKK